MSDLTDEELKNYAYSWLAMIRQDRIAECLISLRHTQTQEKIAAILNRFNDEQTRTN